MTRLLRLFGSREDRLDGLDRVLSAPFQAAAAEETLLWDKELLQHLSVTKDYKVYFHDMSSDAYALGVKRNTIAKMTCEELFHTTLIKNMTCAVWADGKDLVDKDVLELGCGPGVFGRLSGRFARSYTGIDASQFALSIARLTSPKTCRYVHLYDPATLPTLAKSVDVAVGRNFFRHHEHDETLALLRLLRDLTRDGGLIIAELLSEATDDAMIETLAGEAGLGCERIDHRPELPNRYARLRVHGDADGPRARARETRATEPDG